MLGWILNLGMAGGVAITVIAGPYRVTARQTHSAGAVEAQTTEAGAMKAQSYSAGAVAGQGDD